MWRWLGLSAFLATGLLPVPVVTERDFPGPWQGYDGRLVTLVQGSSGVSCPHTGYRRSRATATAPADLATYLVACSTDGRSWHYLRVWPATRTVRHARSSGIAPPPA